MSLYKVKNPDGTSSTVSAKSESEARKKTDNNSSAPVTKLK